MAIRAVNARSDKNSNRIGRNKSHRMFVLHSVRCICRVGLPLGAPMMCVAHSPSWSTLLLAWLASHQVSKPNCFSRALAQTHNSFKHQSGTFLSSSVQSGRFRFRSSRPTGRRFGRSTGRSVKVFVLVRTSSGSPTLARTPGFAGSGSKTFRFLFWFHRFRKHGNPWFSESLAI